MTILEDLQWRGLYADCTDLAALTKRLSEGPLTLYCGFDPTADSLHVGNLVPLLALRRFQLAGHHPIALAGGATGMIGDPSGKSSERNLQTPEQVGHNIKAIKEQLSRFLDFNAATNPARLVDNSTWTAPVTFLEFLRDVGKHFSVNVMIAKDSVRSRLESARNDGEDGISYTEFSYMLLQAHDFLHLRNAANCELQIGATDQWGNITAGTDLIRKKNSGRSAWGLVFPLLTKADGTKYGKSASGAVWLDRNKTSPKLFYEFFLNSADTDVIRLLKVLTFLSREEINVLQNESIINPSARSAQKALAKHLTSLVHGADEAEKAAISSEITFGKMPISSQTEPTLRQIASTIPQILFDLNQPVSPENRIPINKSLTEVVTLSGICPSKGQAKQLIISGGLYVNDERQTDPNLKVTESMLLYDQFLFLRKGTSANAVFTTHSPYSIPLDSQLSKGT